MKTSKSLSLFGTRTAFTLVDLIVVVFTLLLIGALILPALARATDNATRTVCFNNLRRLGVAVAMYGNDNRDYLAPPNWDGGATGHPAGWLYSVTNGTIPDPGPGGPYATNPVAAYNTGLWFQYVKDPSAYLCPVDTESATYQRPVSRGGRSERLSSFIMNGAVCGFGENIQPGTCKITDAWNPGCYLLWGPDENANGPGNPGAFDFNDGSNYPNSNEGVARLHTLNGSDILTVAGNVQFVTVQKWRTESTAPGKSLAWWNPFSVSGH